MKTEHEVRAEIERFKRLQAEHRAAHRQIDAAYAAIFVSALSWVVGEVPAAAVRVKVPDDYHRRIA